MLDREHRKPDPDLSDGDVDDPGPEGNVPDGEDPELEGDGGVNGKEAPETEGKVPDQDVNEFIEDYARNWVNGLDRYDLTLRAARHFNGARAMTA